MANNNTWMWKFSYLFTIVPSMIICILTMTLFSEFDSPVKLIKSNQRPQAEKILSTYIKQDIVEFTLNAFQETIDNEKDADSGIEAKNNGLCHSIKHYSYELRYMIFLVFAKIFTFMDVYISCV